MHPNGCAWFCVRAQPKHEHVAAAHLRKLIEDIEVFNPRFRIRKSTRRGVVWFQENVFPNYLFAKFDIESRLETVKYIPGVSTVVHFGSRTPPVPEDFISELKKNFGPKEVRIIQDTVQQGDEVTISGGAFNGLKAIVTRAMPAPQRVQVLLDLLGRETPVEVSYQQIIREKRQLIDPFAA